MQQTPDKNETWIGQPAYVKQLLDSQGMNECKAVGSPAEPGSHLMKATEKEETMHQQPYQSLIGSLLYLSTCTRPDVAFAVGTLAEFSSQPTKTHWAAAYATCAIMESISGDRKKASAKDIQMPTGQAIVRIEDRHRDMFFRLDQGLCLGEAESRQLWPYPQPRLSM